MTAGTVVILRTVRSEDVRAGMSLRLYGRTARVIHVSEHPDSDVSWDSTVAFEDTGETKLHALSVGGTQDEIVAEVAP